MRARGFLAKRSDTHVVTGQTRRPGPHRSEPLVQPRPGGCIQRKPVKTGQGYHGDRQIQNLTHTHNRRDDDTLFFKVEGRYIISNIHCDHHHKDKSYWPRRTRWKVPRWPLIPAALEKMLLDVFREGIDARGPRRVRQDLLETAQGGRTNEPSSRDPFGSTSGAARVGAQNNRPRKAHAADKAKP